MPLCSSTDAVDAAELSHTKSQVDGTFITVYFYSATVQQHVALPTLLGETAATSLFTTHVPGLSRDIYWSPRNESAPVRFLMKPLVVTFLDDKGLAFRTSTVS